MAKHLTWCFKRTLYFANAVNVYEPCALFRTINSNSAFKSIRRLKAGILIPKYPKITADCNDDDNPKAYRAFLVNTRFNKGLAAKTLTKILSYTTPDANGVIENYPVLGRMPPKSIMKIFEILRQAGFLKTTIIEHPFLLADPSGELEQKINIVKKIDIDINDAAHLFNLSLKRLRDFQLQSKLDATYLPDSNRFQYLAGKLGFNMRTICRWMSYNSFLLMMPAPKLMSVTECFLEAGVAPEHILSDPVAYRFSLNLITEKLKLAKEVGVHPLKLWVIRSSAKGWERCKLKYDNKKNALSIYVNRTQALCEIFNCEQAEVEHFKYKLPKFDKIGTEKLLKIARLLVDAGYTIHDLQISPRVLHRKHDTLKELIELTKKYGCKRRQLWTLLLSKEKFERCIIQDKFGELNKT